MNVWVLAQADLVGAATPDLMPSIWRMFIGLALVLAMIAALAWLVKRGVLGRRPAGLLGVESTLALGDRRQLLVVTVEGRRLLLGVAPNHVSLVTELQARPFEQAVAMAVERDARR
ncbi:MAG: flagellar biosynthetic protein FliO [Acidobacteriota bacterium]